MKINLSKSDLIEIITSAVNTVITESKYIKKKPNGKWGVISGKTGKFWDADYDSEEDAKAGLRGYFANKN